MSTVSEFEFEKLLEELETLRAENAKLIAEPAQQISEVTPKMLRVAQTETELGAIACANYSGGYSLITELFEKMLSASQPKGNV